MHFPQNFFSGLCFDTWGIATNPTAGGRGVCAGHIGDTGDIRGHPATKRLMQLLEANPKLFNTVRCTCDSAVPTSHSERTHSRGRRQRRSHMQLGCSGVQRHSSIDRACNSLQRSDWSLLDLHAHHLFPPTFRRGVWHILEWWNLIAVAEDCLNV